MVNATRWFVTIAALTLAACQTTPSTQSALVSERAAIYQAFLASYLENTTANVGDQTFQLSVTNRDIAQCAEGLRFDTTTAGAASTHDLHEDLAGVANVQLVNAEQQRAVIAQNDPSASVRRGLSTNDAVDAAFNAALLRLSEVAFDETSQHAILEYSFVCGGLCGNGGVVLLEKRESGEWRMSSRRCGGGWMS